VSAVAPKTYKQSNKQTNKNRLVVADQSFLEHDIAFIGNFTDI